MTIGTMTTTLPSYNFIDVLPLASSESDVNGTNNARVFNLASGGGATSPFVTFGAGVSAFGADFKNLNDTALRTKVKVYDGATLLATLSPSVVAIGAVRF